MGSGYNQKNKQRTLAELAAMVPDGASIALGGSLHRGPFGFVRELIRQGKRDLELIKQSPGYDVDILCRAGGAACARASWPWKATSAWRPGIARRSSVARSSWKSMPAPASRPACGRRRSACHSSPAAACMAAACPS